MNQWRHLRNKKYNKYAKKQIGIYKVHRAKNVAIMWLLVKMQFINAYQRRMSLRNKVTHRKGDHVLQRNVSNTHVHNFSWTRE